MTAPPAKQWGLTPPISTSLPSSDDHNRNAELIEELKAENSYEGAAETNKRMATLKLLARVTTEFVKDVSRRQKLPPSQIEQFGGKIYPYGSYRLGVFGPGSDIDTLAVAPRHVKREDFFDLYPSVLRRLAPADAVSSLTAVPDSFVPIIKLVLNGIEIDLIFVAIESLMVIPKDLSLNDNRLLDGLDQSSIRAITGPRVTDEILSLVPEQKTFRTALRAIKLWAQRRAVYANIVGYPGGVAWAMMVARVCQLYPHAIGATIVHRFFYIMKNWQWPMPIMLKTIESGKEKVWNPQIYPSDKKNIMPIITPAYPSMCATYNISKSGKAVILKELERGYQITADIFEGRLKWKDLFMKHSFFTSDHRYYLGIIASSTNQDAAKAWSGLVESKVRILVMQLELLADLIDLARPFTKGFKRVHKCSNDEQAAEIRRGSTQYQVEETKTIETTDPELVTANGDGAALPEVKDAKPEGGVNDGQTIYTITFYIGIDLKSAATKNVDMSSAIRYFTSICKAWPNFNEGMHELNVVPCKNHDLPDDLFDSSRGETKPAKPSKKKGKRTHTEAEETTTNGKPIKRSKLATPSQTPTPTPA